MASSDSTPALETCSICLLDLTEENEAKIDCTEQLLHRYHIDCIEGEIKEVSKSNSQRKLACPLCRASFTKIFYNNEIIIIEDRIRLYQESEAIEDDDVYSDEDSDDEDDIDDDRVGNCCVCDEGCYQIRDIHHTRRAGNRNSTENPPILLCKIRYCDSVCHANCIGRDVSDRSPWLCALCSRRREMQRQRRLNARQQYEIATTNQAFTAATAYNPSQIIQKQIEKARDNTNSFNNELISGGSGTCPCDLSQRSTNSSASGSKKRPFAVSYEQYMQFVTSTFTGSSSSNSNSNSNRNSNSNGNNDGSKRYKSSLIKDSLDKLNSIKSSKSVDTLSGITSTDSLEQLANRRMNTNDVKAVAVSAPSSAVKSKADPKTKGVKEVLYDLFHPIRSSSTTNSASNGGGSGSGGRGVGGSGGSGVCGGGASMEIKNRSANDTITRIKSCANAIEVTNTIRCLSSNSDVRYIYALLDAGLLDCISAIIDLSNPQYSIQQKEMILRALHSLPVKSKHLRHSTIMSSLSKIATKKDNQSDDAQSLDIGAYVILCRRVSNEFKDVLRHAKEKLGLGATANGGGQSK